MWLLAALAVALPLAFDPAGAIAFGVAKAGVLGIFAYALGATLLVKTLVAGVGALPRTWLLVPVLMYLVTMALATAFAVDTNIALWGAYDRRLGLISTIQMGVVCVAAATFVRTRGDAITVYVGAAIGGTLVLAYAIAQRLGIDPVRWVDAGGAVFSSLGNSNIMGHYFAVLSAATVAALLSGSVLSWRQRRSIALAMLFGAWVAGTVLSGARAAMLGLAVGAAAAVALATWRLLAQGGRRWAAIGVAIGAILLALGVLFFTPAGARVATLAQGGDLSVSERSLLYQTILRIVADRPLLGVGPDNLAAVYNSYRPVEALQFGALLTQSSGHGWPWRVMLDAGAIGLLAFSALAVVLAVAAGGALRGAYDWRVPVSGVALITYLSAGLFAVNDVGTDWLFWLAAGVLVGTRASRAMPVRRLTGWRVAVALLLAVGALWPIAAAARDTNASRAMFASRSLANRDVPGALLQARKAVDDDDRWPAAWNALGLRALDAGDRALALSSFERASEVGPFDPLIWTNLGTLQAQLSRQQPALADRARVSAERAAAADPRNPVARAGAGQIYLVLGDGGAAAREAEAALALAPNNEQYLELAGTGYLQARQAEAALSAIQKAIGLRETWQRRLLLARIHLLRDDPQAASIELRRVLELDVGNREATTLLQQLVGR